MTKIFQHLKAQYSIYLRPEKLYEKYGKMSPNFRVITTYIFITSHIIVESTLSMLDKSLF